MKIINRIAVIFFLLIAVSCTSGKKIADSTTINHLSANAVLVDGGIVYGLPRSVFTIVAEMQRTIEIPGPYWRYAGDLLGLDKVIQNENEYWSITGISVKTNEEIDPSELYVISSNTLFESNVLALKNEGLILDLDSKIFSSAGNTIETGRGEDRHFRSLDMGSDEYYLIQRDTAFKRVSVDSSFIRIPYIVEKKRKLSDEQLAERAARRLMEMRDGKHLILTGEANVFPQHEAAIIEMNRLEKEYTELFTGKTLRETRTFTYQTIPDKTMAGIKVPLFRFSELTGPAASDQKDGNPVIIEFLPEKKTKDLVVKNKIQPENAEMQVYDKIYYRVPDVASVKISIDEEILFNSRRLVYQFGEIVQLPANYLIGK